MNSTPLPTETDDFDGNIVRLCSAYASGLSIFLVGFILAYFRTRHQHETQTISHVPELTLVKLNTKLLRTLCVFMLIVQVALFAHAMAIPDTGNSISFFDSINRPLGSMLGIAFGFSTNFHSSFRVFVVIFLTCLVIVDTISEVHYDSIKTCAKKGALCSSAKSLTLDRLNLLIARDLVAISIQLWALLTTSYLCLAIGICHSRYTQRQLSISNPYSNIRDLLLKHHPHLNNKQSV